MSRTENKEARRPQRGHEDDICLPVTNNISSTINLQWMAQAIDEGLEERETEKEVDVALPTYKERLRKDWRGGEKRWGPVMERQEKGSGGGGGERKGDVRKRYGGE